MGEPEDRAAIMLFAPGPSDDLVERQRVEDPGAPPRRIPQLPCREDPPIRDERVSAAPREQPVPPVRAMIPGRRHDRRATGAVARWPSLGRGAAPHGSDGRRAPDAPARACGEASFEAGWMLESAHDRSPVISRSRRYPGHAGWSSLVARWAHNPEVTGSNPVPATRSTSANGRGRISGPFLISPEFPHEPR